MRVSSNMLFDSNVAAMTQQQAKLMQTQQQISTGRKILTASDDPVAAARALDVTQSDAMNTQYAANRGAARHTLSLAESTLQGVTALLQDVKTTTVNAGNGTLNATDLRTMATALSGRLQELTGLANSTDGVGNYLFAGFQSRTTPFMSTAAGVAYFGDDGQRNVQVSATRQMPSSGNGADIFMRIKNGNGTFATQASASNTGYGVIGLGAISNPALLTGDSYTIAYNGPTPVAAAANTGTGVISTPTVVTPASVTGLDYQVAFNDIVTQPVAGSTGTIATPATVVTPASLTGHDYRITVDGAGVFAVQDLTLGAPVAAVFTPGALPGDPDTLDFDGIQVAVTGAVPNDSFNVLAPTYNVTELPAGSNTQVITSLDFTNPGNIAIPASTAVSGAFTNINLGIGESYSMSITSNAGTVNLFNQTNVAVTAADIDSAIATNAVALATAGITASGSAALGTLVFSDATGQQLTTNVLNQSGAGGFANTPLGTGIATTLQTATTVNGVQANSASFIVDAAGENDLVTLTGTYANEAALLAKIQADLDADLPGTFTVTGTGTVAAANFSFTIERVSAGAASTAVTVSAADAGALAKGIVNSAGTVGGASVATNQAYVSGQPINFGGMQVNIQGVPNPSDSFTVSSPGYIVTNNTTLATIPTTGRMLYVAGQPMNFDIDGMRIDIQGTPADGDTFTVSPSTNESIFKTISDLITSLNAPVVGASLTNSLNTGLNNLENSLNNVLTTRSSLGLRLNEVDALQTAGEDLGLQFKQTLSELQDVDYNQAISDLVRQQTNLQAAQQTFSKVAGLSLFDYI